MMKFFLSVITVFGVVIYLSIPKTSYHFGELRTKTLKDGLVTDLKVGVVWPFSTTNNLFKEGIELAVEEINEKGIHGRKFNIVYKDTASDQKKAIKIAKEFVETPDMFAVMGHYDSNTVAKTSISYERAKLFYINTGALGSFLSEHNFNYFVRTSMNTDMLAKKMVLALSKEGYKMVYHITQEDSYGQDIAFNFKNYLDFMDMRICRSDSYFRWDKKFHKIIYDLRGENCDVVFVAGYEPWAWKFLSDMRDMGVTLPFVAAATSIDSLMEIAPKAAEGAMFYTYYDPHSNDSNNVKFYNTFKKKYGMEPDVYAATGYDSIKMLAEAIERTKSIDPLNLVYYFKYIMHHVGVNGTYSFTSKGEVRERPFYLMKVENGKGVMVRSLEPDYNVDD
ncbi:ABC transporter substrate-binding protein [Sulfurospirillum barnesii]|uniref:Amino acid/amide ABC transporter substrate-binding protein, HAAT family n=1 Tax=Sulfurospirillum barnesii (strain ATCC 700032 / DSM 10660 / SES-3) TaxID=760154 RepID=I3XVS8_SULBS|nr:ABC transporter substrate-binding protein [Sulfurospirillum barnesii]AFL68052.1 amino acid/amide ABC transporter substrate-binding protein, HAAT family [Sulfurospirillum barnesii SES-3]